MNSAATVPEQTHHHRHQYHRSERGAHVYQRKQAQESMAASSTSTAFFFRQTPSESVTVNHQIEAHIKLDIINDDDQNSHDDRSTPSVLSKLVKERDFDGFSKLGGVEGIGNYLKTDMHRGIKGSSDEISRRIQVFGVNTCAIMPRTKTFSGFVREASLKFKDVDAAFGILLFCSALLLGFGIKADGLRKGWYEGGGILLAVLVVISVSAITNFSQDRQFDKLSMECRNIPAVLVVRDGNRQRISIPEIVVGDVVVLKVGDQVPADGLFIEGHSLVVDESSMTGGSDTVKVNSNRNPFLFSGTKVERGYAKMLVIAVGKNTTSWGVSNILSLESLCDGKTPLQARLDNLSSVIRMLGLTVALLVLVLLSVRYLITGKTKDENGRSKTKDDEEEVVIKSVVRIIVAVVAIVVVAIPQGLALAVTVTLTYSIKKMMTADQATIVRKTSASETMGLVTAMCTDIIGITLKVTKAFISSESMEGKSYTSIKAKVLELFLQGISSSRDSVHNLSADTKIDDAVHLWAVTHQNMETESSQDFLILDVEASCSELNKRIGVLVKRKSDNIIHVHWRGDAERIISSSSHYFDSTGTSTVLDEQQRGKLKQNLENIAACGLICIAFAYKELTEEELGNEMTDNQKIPDEGLILLGYVGLKVLHHPDTKEAVKSCQHAEINVTITTTENSSVATAIAKECGILSSNDQDELVVEGEEFRNYTEIQRMERVEKIRVMARSSPSDKLLLVQCLQKRGHVVAVSGDGKSDIPALKEADVSLAMGIQGTQVAKENSDIVILDDKFSSIVTVLRWGRYIHDNIKKLIQFQLTVNVASLIINFVAAVSSGEVILTAVQLLWVNLVTNTLGALALATEKPRKVLVSIGQTEPLIINVMWRNITSQALYQIAVILFFKFKGVSIIFGAHESVIKSTFIFTSFVLLQVFNLFNGRKLQGNNVFEGILSNELFLGIIGVIIILQVVMVEFLNKFFDAERLDWKEWGVCVGIAVFSLLIGWLVKFIPCPKGPSSSI